MPSFFTTIAVEASTGAFKTINSADSAGTIKSMTVNNGTTNLFDIRVKSNTNSTTFFGNGTFTFQRVNPGDLEVRSFSTNTFNLSICCGNAENPA